MPKIFSLIFALLLSGCVTKYEAELSKVRFIDKPESFRQARVDDLEESVLVQGWIEVRILSETDILGKMIN